MNYTGSSQTVNSRGLAPSGRRRPIHLVLVDDDDDFREAASGELEDLGFTVQSFADGADMLTAFQRGMRADVIVLDWYMPAMMGIDVLTHVRRLESMAENAVQMHFSAQSHRTNEIMRTLTVLTAIFLPLNLVTGFFGMNFEGLPLIHSARGFWIIFSVMLVLGLGLSWFFWRKRYLGRTR